MNYSFLIHSSVDGHLGCFRILAIVNSAAMNTGVHMTFSIIVSSGYMPSSGIVGSYDGFILSFQRNLHMFSIVAISIYIPTAVLEGSFFSKNSKWLFKRGHFPISTSLKLWTRGKKKKKLALGTKWLPLSKHTHAHTHKRYFCYRRSWTHGCVLFKWDGQTPDQSGHGGTWNNPLHVPSRQISKGRTIWVRVTGISTVPGSPAPVRENCALQTSNASAV